MEPAADASTSKYQVVDLWLRHPREMFLLPQTDLFSEYRNFLTGVDHCISELRGRFSSRPVRLEISLPAAEISAGVAERLATTLHRYCNDRIRYNRRETLALRFGGLTALAIGLPIAAIGFGMTVGANLIQPAAGIPHVIADNLGWVLVWIGLWFPLDQLIFYPHGYGRESRVLRLLADAEVVLIPHDPDAPPGGAALSAAADRNRPAGPDVVPSPD